MNRTYKILIILITAFTAAALLVFCGLNIGLEAAGRIKNAESGLEPHKRILFRKLDLGYSIEEQDFLKIENSQELKDSGFTGYQLLENDQPVYQSEAVADFHKKEWKKSSDGELAIIRSRGTSLSVIFVNANTGHEFRGYIKVIDRELITQTLFICMFILCGYLLLLIILLSTFIFTIRRNESYADSAEEHDESGHREVKEFILSLNCLQKFDNFIAEAISKYLPFSVAVLRVEADDFDEENHEDGFSLLRTHIKFNNGYYEYDNSQMVLLLPDTALKEAIKLLEEFTARIIEDNINVNLHGGVTSMNGRPVTSAVLIHEAERALDKAVTENDNMVVGFNPDPDKYREMVNRSLKE